MAARRNSAVLLIISYTFLCLIEWIIIHTPAPIGYEFSVYAAYPPVFWLLLVGELGAITAFLLIYSDSVPKTITFLGLVALFITYTIFLGIPYWRYELWGRADDFLTHLGYIKDIELSKFSVPAWDIYPAIHVYGVILKEIINSSLINTGYIMFISFTLFVYLGGVSLVAGRLPDMTIRDLKPAGIIFGTPLMFGVFHLNTHPSIISAWYLFFVLYFHVRYLTTPRKEYLITLGIIMIFLTFLHPIILIFLSVWFIIIYIFARTLDVKKHRANLTLSALPAVLFSIWYLKFYNIQYYIRSIFQILTGEYYVPSRAELYGSLAKSAISAGLTLPQLLRSLILRYGSPGISILMSIISATIIIKKTHTMGEKPSGEDTNRFVSTFVLILLVFSMVWGMIMFFGYFVELKPIRLFRFMIVSSIMINGIGLYYLHGTQNTKTKNLVLITAFVMIVLSVFSVYQSPLMFSANLQTTTMELNSAGFLLDHKAPSIQIISNTPLFIYRLVDYIEGTSYENRIRAKVNPNRLPSHFGCPSNCTQLLKEPQYIYLTKFDMEYPFKVLPENVRNAAHQYTIGDIELLLSQNNVFVVYKNREVVVFLVNEQQNAEG
ncbi:hypothetical protein [Thermococcus camini]|uniref:Glycosyltransferase RgtA/B/C/D-like domain-containing protein n=1 Tax=Thermococcus camini TaxID=2016373 RepID=A0A7G2D4Z0_9EURY|nr:hypothetical protein [Thermococcus camini]CAD5243336.1 membrane protein of unknown function [Thermococcus camini]